MGSFPWKRQKKGRQASAAHSVPLRVEGLSQPLIEACSVTKVYETGAGGFTALKDITLEVYPGEFVKVVGKSGAGKTTLLNMLSGVSELTEGEVRYYPPDGGPSIGLAEMNEDQLAEWRGCSVGIVYQSFELLPQLDLVDNIMMPQDFAGRFSPGASQERALELLELVGLSEHAYKLPAHISGGQKQRVAIARALVNDPALILADEPTGNLDTVTAQAILELFRQLVGRGKTVVMVTHDTNLAMDYARTIQIVDGEIVSSGENGSGGAPALERHTAGELAGHMHSERLSGEAALAQGGTAGQPAIVLRDVVKTFVNASGSFTALKGVNLQMNYGQFVSIVGKSGSGKSTLLNMLTGIDHPSSGQVLIGGQDLYRLSESKRALWRGRNLGIVFQFFQLLPTLTLLENTMLPMDYCQVYPAGERRGRALELLRRVGLEEQAHKLPSMVSSGQQQSAAIARALATDPPIIVADEPTGNLDSRSAAAIIQLFQDLAAQGKTILIVTHDPSITRRTDQTVILSDGEIIDEAIARALPLLNHPLMLQATKQAVHQTYQPGETILRQHSHVTQFFMVAGGEVEVVMNRPGCPEISLARLGPGQFFGEVEVLDGDQALASVRAAPGQPAVVAALERELFLRLLSEAPAMAAELKQVALQRVVENAAQAGERCE